MKFDASASGTKAKPLKGISKMTPLKSSRKELRASLSLSLSRMDRVAAVSAATSGANLVDEQPEMDRS
jgi:hypothetical protein